MLLIKRCAIDQNRLVDGTNQVLLMHQTKVVESERFDNGTTIGLSAMVRVSPRTNNVREPSSDRLSQ